MSYQILISLSFFLALVGIVIDINNLFGEATIYISISSIVIAALILKHALDEYTIDDSSKVNLIQNKLDEVFKLLNDISVNVSNNNDALVTRLDRGNQLEQTRFEDVQRELVIVKDNINLVNLNVGNSNDALVAKIDRDNQLAQDRLEDIQRGIAIAKEDINQALEHIGLKISEVDKHKEHLENLITNAEKIYGGINTIKDSITKLNKLIIEKTDDIQQEILFGFESKLSDIQEDLQKTGKRNRESIFELMGDVEKLKNLIEKYQSEISSLDDILGKTIDSMKNEREYNEQLLTQYMDLTMKDNEIISNILKK